MNWWQRLVRREQLEDRLDDELRYHFDRHARLAWRSADGAGEGSLPQRAWNFVGGVLLAGPPLRTSVTAAEPRIRDGCHRYPALIIGANTAIFSVGEIVSASVAQRRFQMVLVVLFVGLSLALALVGIYGVASYSVTRQTQEIGLRMALGAQARDVVRSILMQGLRPVLAGLVIGLVGARLAADLVRSFLFGIGPLDPAPLGGVVLVLLVAGGMACYLPARRTARMDPTIALRCE